MNKLIFIGIDGMDPKITEQMMDAGHLPNFSRLASNGSYKKLNTLNPAQSPVVWSTISTGVYPGEHGIFDFILRDPASYKPYLSLQQIKDGKYINPVKAETFWEKRAGDGIGSVILKWPMGFPPRPFTDGRMLAGLGVPDLR
ncbi:alkaline phosphatase family protein, partial [Candidatus Desantisbacteria bacterium]|nr:alkaline phosphatase family protein [Candidatus Desantisbacteria bacterium]